MNVTDEAIELACREDNIYDLKVSLPDGFNTLVDSKDALLSASQGTARTSAADTSSERGKRDTRSPRRTRDTRRQNEEHAEGRGTY